MCIGLFGVQIVWGLQNVDTSRIFQTLGAEIAQLPILWIAAPITGLLIQPLIGYWSDRTWGPLGRRRPFVLGGALLTALAMVVMPNVTSLFAASVALWLLTASVNIAAEPFRALVADNLPEEQRTEGYAVQVFFIGAGAVFSSALPWILSHWFGVIGVAPPGQLPPSVRLTFEIGAAGLVATVLWTVVTTRERPPESLVADAIARTPRGPLSATGEATLTRSGLAWTAVGLAIGGIAWARGLEHEIYVLAAIAVTFGFAQFVVIAMRRRGHTSLGLFEIVEDILHMPGVMRRLAVVQFLTWFGLFCFWIYAIPAVSAHHYGASDTTSAAYNEAADWVGILFAGYNAVAALGAFLLPPIAQRIGRPATHAICLVLGAAGLFGFVMIDDPMLLWVPVIGIGCAWAAILALPYAMIASAVPPDKMGVYMGIHNTFLVLPQLFAATVLGAIVNHLFGAQAILALGLAAMALLAAALAALTIKETQPL
ncbi:SLC45 family MFS transporter [Sphingomonas panacisoli]|uniref:SLC45 family MFS transporter n=2 Tax=Sphingomonas panacisoli TaxID=1813879 RepID=A0A5B8LNB5_9SPHN|nr:SLC45 family MFS transporter [Sphingomonas panacisoli]